MFISRIMLSNGLPPDLRELKPQISHPGICMPLRSKHASSNKNTAFSVNKKVDVLSGHEGEEEAG